MSTSRVDEIVAYLNKNRTDMERFLKQLVTLESPSKDAAAQDALFQLLGKAIKDLDFYCLRIFGKKTGGYLYARPIQRDKNKGLQLLIGHCDTVWEKNTLRKMPVINQLGKLTGPGVYDMKAGLTQLIFALKAIKELKIELPLNPVILINSDEEIGSVESGSAIERLAKISDRTYVMEPPLGLDGKLKTARKGIGRFKIIVVGKAAHAGLDPASGVNAIVELSKLVQQLYAMNDLERGITVNVGMIQGGTSPNVVAPQSSAVIDVRVNNMVDGQFITDQIHGLQPSVPEVSLQIEGGIGRPPM
ncbi:MAG: M20/M25/M40 family metallo-hydrolase, partial [Flavobacteriaceae bacterium]